jgi:hypothetical protein
VDGSQIPLTDLVGHSYGINTWDPWSKMLANEFDMETTLYDCFKTKPFTGPSADYHRSYSRLNMCVGPVTETRADPRPEHKGGFNEFQSIRDSARLAGLSTVVF